MLTSPYNMELTPSLSSAPAERMDVAQVYFLSTRCLILGAKGFQLFCMAMAAAAEAEGRVISALGTTYSFYDQPGLKFLHSGI